VDQFSPDVVVFVGPINDALDSVVKDGRELVVEIVGMFGVLKVERIGCSRGVESADVLRPRLPKLVQLLDGELVLCVVLRFFL